MLVDARGQNAALVWLKQTWNARQTAKTKWALKKAKGVLVQMQMAWGDEMRAGIDEMEDCVDALRANLRRFMQRDVVEEEDAPDRFHVHVPSLLPCEQAFADGFFSFGEGGANKNDDENKAF